MFHAAMIALTSITAAAPEVEAVRANQHGYLTDGPKRATVVSATEVPHVWRLVDRAGATVAEGETIPFGEDAASGEAVHLIDFSAVGATGEALALAVDGVFSDPFDIGDDVYWTLKYDALAFFYHQRASVQIEAKFVGRRWARPAAHDPDAATCYGPEDFRGNTWGGCPYTLDVSKGWYDAGDHGKYVVNGGISVWTLMHYYERFGDDAFADGDVRIPEAGDGVNDLLNEVRWQMEFMLAMQVPDGTRLTLPRGDQFKNLKELSLEAVDASGLVHHKVADERWTPLPMRPELDPETRYLHYPSTAATLNLAAVAAQCARIWAAIDEAFSERCLVAAESAYAAAKRLPDLYAIDVTDGGSGAYGDRDLTDEFYWAATELFVTTGARGYRRDMARSPLHLAAPLSTEPGRDIAWPAVETLGALTLLAVDSRLSGRDRRQARANIIASADAFLKEADAEGYGVPFSRAYNWGSNGDMSNRGMILATAYVETGEKKYRDGVIAVLDYLLGRNPLGRSYVAGYGENPMVEPHHRFWAPSLDDSLPPPPAGALAGGPNATAPADEIARRLIIGEKCAPQTCYEDDYRAYSLNEVAINWNAPFFWIAAASDRFARDTAPADNR